MKHVKTLTSEKPALALPRSATNKADHPNVSQSIWFLLRDIQVLNFFLPLETIYVHTRAAKTS